MSNIPACPQCTLENTYPDGENYICPDCAFEWPMQAAQVQDESDDRIVKDSNGNVLADGDAVVLIKDLKVKGSSITLKMGSKVKSIRLVGGDHEVDCKMDAGNFMLKACYLKKYSFNHDRSKKPPTLDGITLEAILLHLEQHYGWEELGRRIAIQCFLKDPSISSSLKFLRKTPWARTKVEQLYLASFAQ